MNRALERMGKLQTFGKLAEKRNVFSGCAYDVVKNKWRKTAISVLSGMQTGPKAGCRNGKPA